MESDVLRTYTSEINKAYLRGDAIEHTHQHALKRLLLRQSEKKFTATNEPKQIVQYLQLYVRTPL